MIIPEEAERLIPVIRKLDPPGAHLLVYAAPITKGMLQFNRANFYSLPKLEGGQELPDKLIIELGILGGRLYFEIDEYEDIVNYLHLQDVQDDAPTSVPGDRFTANPIGFLEE